MPGVWQPSTGAMLGTATGAIRIDTSDVERAGTVTKASAKEISDAFNKVDQAAKKPKAALVTLANDISKVRGEIFALSAGAGVLSGIGLQVASNMQAAAIQFTGLTGGIKEANTLMVDLRKKGLAAGIPFQDMLKSAKQLLPTLEGNTTALDTYIRLAQRVAVLNPAEGISGAAFAINEALASGGTDLVSLSERFQVSRTNLRQALQETGGDFATALDLVLNKMGITSQVAEDMGRSFGASLARAKDSAGQLLGVGFAPLLDTMTPLLDQATQFMMTLQETNPELMTMAAGTLAIVAAGGPLLLMLSQVITSLQTIKTLSIAGSLGKAGAIGLSVAGGVGLGVAATQGIGRATGNEQMASAGLGDLFNIIKTYTLAALQGLAEFGIKFADAANQVQNALGQFIMSIGIAAQSIAELISRVFPNKGAEYSAGAKGIIEFGQSLIRSQEELDKLHQLSIQQRDEMLQGALKFLFPELSGAGGETGGTGGSAGGAAAVEEFTTGQVEAFAEFQESMKQLEEDGAEQRLRINEQYQEAVANIEERLADMRKRIAKAEQDAAEQEAKREEDYQRSRQEVIEDAREADIRAIEEFNRRKERDEREHKNNLYDAASRFDALGIIREMRAYSEKRRQSEEDYTAAQQQRAEELAQRLAQEAEAHNREMQELRQANRERINEMRQEYAEELRLAQEKLMRLHDAHVRELQDLDQKLVRERDARQRAFIQQFNDLAGSLTNQINISRQGQKQMLSDLRIWWDRMRSEMNNGLSGDGGGETPGDDEGGGDGGHDPHVFPLATGGPITDTSKLYQLHADEEVLRPDVARQIRYAMGGAINQPALAAAIAGGSSGGVSIGSVTIPIYGAPGQPVEGIRDAVRDALADIIDKYNKSIVR